MQIFINHQPRELPEGATLADAIQALQPQPPFAAAVNLQFVPRTAYGQQALHDGDRIEIIAPVTGG